MFDGVGDTIDATVSGLTADFSLAAWVNVDAINNVNAIYSSSANAYDNYFLIANGRIQINFAESADTNERYYQSTGVLTA